MPDWKCALCDKPTDTLYFYDDKEICESCYRVKKLEEPNLCQGKEVEDDTLARTCPHCQGVWDTIRGLKMHINHGCKQDRSRTAS